MKKIGIKWRLQWNQWIKSMTKISRVWDLGRGRVYSVSRVKNVCPSLLISSSFIVIFLDLHNRFWRSWRISWTNMTHLSTWHWACPSFIYVDGPGLCSRDQFLSSVICANRGVKIDPQLSQPFLLDDRNEKGMSMIHLKLY